MEQREVVPDLVPKFCAVDPFADDPCAYIDIDYPFWIKPVKAHSSRLGFKIRNAAELKAHLPEIREKIGFFGEPFGEYLRHVGVPESIRPITGYWCIAEELISFGRQCTLEGYIYDGEVVVYGIVDSLRSGKHRSCFSRYQYPSTLPKTIQERMIDATTCVLTRFSYDGGPFNIEFYWDRRTDSIRLLEVNARISKSHCPMFRLVDGASHQEVMVDLAMGERPRFPHRKGPFRMAAKFMHRVFADGIVDGMPTAREIEAVKKLYPEARIRLLAEVGERLKYSHHHDSYSYELADIFLGGNDQGELLRKFHQVLEMVTFNVAPVFENAA
jgi:biotin carboxylase